jgi:TRAP-type C4-dicarboxylate transport system permease small subunit
MEVHRCPGIAGSEKENGMERLFRWALTLLMIIVAGMEFIQVATRYVLQIPMMGLEEILVYFALWLYVLGSVNASREDTQITANVLDVFLKTERSKLMIRVTADVMGLVVALWLTWWAWDYFLYSWKVWKLSPTRYIPTFYAECSLFIGLALMTIYGSVHFARNVKRLLASPVEA